MTIKLNETHDPARRSFVESANEPGTDFPIQNLPFGVFRPAPGQAPRVGVAIGDQIVDVAAAGAAFDGLAAEAAKACSAASLNALMSLGPETWSALRLALSRALSTQDGDETIARHLTAMAQAEILLPVADSEFHRFLCFGFSRHQCRPHVPARQSADAELQICPGRLSQPGLVGSRQRHRVQAAARPAQTAERDGAELRSVAQSRLRAWNSASTSACRANWANLFRSARRPNTFSAFACSTTGRRATCRPGNISRSARSWRRIFPPRSRLGW